MLTVGAFAVSSRRSRANLGIVVLGLRLWDVVRRLQIFLTKHFTGMGADAWHGCSVYLLKRRGAVASGDGCGAVESQQAPG
jgi:hypothetical protein